MAQSNAANESLPDMAPARRFLLVAGCFLISGFAALLYETVWLRQFAILLGTSEQSLAVVLASYMGGLAIGSLVASRVAYSIRRPLLTYGLLELGIGLSALLVPVGLSAAGWLQASLLAGSAEPPDSGSLSQIAFCFATAFGLILVPTGLMGATLPLLARHVVSRNQDLGPRVGFLYAINTAGAVIGTLVAAFYCLPSFGLGRTTWIGAAANLLVFVLVVGLVRVHADRGVTFDESQQPQLQPQVQETRNRRKGRGRRRGQLPGEGGAAPPPRFHLITWLAAFSGAVAFCYEIVFTRMLSHWLGGSVFAFATMLAGFLLGIAIGSAIASRLARTRRDAVTGFVYAEACAAVCTLLAFHLVDSMMTWTLFQETGPAASLTPIRVLASILVLLPTATCIGATFPFAIRAYAKDETEAARGSGCVYGWNVFGGILGAMVTGAVLLPRLQYHGTTTLAVFGNIIIAIGAIELIRACRRVHLALPMLAAAMLLIAFPGSPQNVLRMSALAGTPTPGEILYSRAGRSATVTVFYDQGSLLFQSNGLPEAKIYPIGSGGAYRHEATWLTALPPLVRPGCESMLVVGLGGGVAVEMVPPSVETIDVFELEPAVVEANRAVAQLRERDPLADPRIRIIVNDARNGLALTDKKYDAIVSQPSHPWTAGASHLYTREFCQLVADHLTPGGIYLQWMHAGFVDRDLTRSMGTTLLEVFPHVRMYQPVRGAFMFVASDKPLLPEQVLSSASDGELAWPGVSTVDREYYRRLGIVTPTHLFALLSLDEEGLATVCQGATPVTDERNLLAMRAPSLLGKHDEEKVQALVEAHSPVVRGLDAALELCPSLDLTVFANQILPRTSSEWVRRYVLPLVDQPDERALIEAELIRADQGLQAWMAYLTYSAMKYPQNEDLAFLLLSSAALGNPLAMSAEEQQQLRGRLGTSHRKVVELVDEMFAGNLESARRYDAQLAQIPADDVAYELAVRLRIPWRLEAQGSEQIRRAREALEIIDQAAALANEDGLAWFRAAAALNAGRPLVALGTIGELANSVKMMMADHDGQVDGAALSSLIRCHDLLRNRAAFASVDQRYKEVMTNVVTVLQQTTGK